MKLNAAPGCSQRLVAEAVGGCLTHPVEGDGVLLQDLRAEQEHLVSQEGLALFGLGREEVDGQSLQAAAVLRRNGVPAADGGQSAAGGYVHCTLTDSPADRRPCRGAAGLRQTAASQLQDGTLRQPRRKAVPQRSGRQPIPQRQAPDG